MFSTQARFQITRVPSINESAVVAPAQNRNIPFAVVATTSPVMFGVQRARTPPPEPLPTMHEHGLSPAKQPIDSQLPPAMHDGGTEYRVSMS